MPSIALLLVVHHLRPPACIPTTSTGSIIHLTVTPSLDEDDLSNLAVSIAYLRSSSPAPDIDQTQECTGVLVQWMAGSVWDTYLYHQHRVRNHPWEPTGFEGNDNWLRLRSKDCCIVLWHQPSLLSKMCCNLHSGNSCYKCCGAHSYMTQRQLHSLLLKVTSKYRELTLKVHFAIFWT